MPKRCEVVSLMLIFWIEFHKAEPTNNCTRTEILRHYGDKLVLRYSDEIVNDGCKVIIKNHVPETELCFIQTYQPMVLYTCTERFRIYTTDPGDSTSTFLLLDTNVYYACLSYERCVEERTLYARFVSRSSFDRGQDTGPNFEFFTRFKKITTTRRPYDFYTYESSEEDFDTNYDYYEDGLVSGSAWFICTFFFAVAFCCICTAILSKKRGSDNNSQINQSSILDVTQAPHSRLHSRRSSVVQIEPQERFPPTVHLNARDRYIPPNYYVPSAPPDYQSLVHQYQDQDQTSSNANIEVLHNLTTSDVNTDAISGDEHYENLPPPPGYEEVMLNFEKYSSKVNTPGSHNNDGVTSESNRLDLPDV